jgi:voltage-gated potassium channel
MTSTTVNRNPQTRLKRFEDRTEWPLAIAALLFLVSYSGEVLDQPQGFWKTATESILWAIWAVFIIEYFARLCLATDRLRWFVRHLLDFAIVALPVLRPLRLLRMVVLVAALEKVIGSAVRGRVIIYTAFTAVLLVYAGSLAILDAERHHLGTKINTLGDALWWSICTVTTVGYGDESPVTGSGRLIAALLMIGGIGLVGTVTATIASWIVQRVSQEGSQYQAETAAQIEAVREDIRLQRNDFRDRVQELRDEIQQLEEIISSQQSPPGTRNGHSVDAARA